MIFAVRQVNTIHHRRINVGLEFRLETYDPQRVNLEHELRKLPEFLNIENNGNLNLTIDGKEIAVTVCVDDGFVYVVQHVTCRETDAILGLLIRKILTLNDHVVVSDFDL